MVPFALDACFLMAASLSSPQPANPRKPKLNRARLKALVNNFMASMTLLKAGRDDHGSGGRGIRNASLASARLDSGVALRRLRPGATTRGENLRQQRPGLPNPASLASSAPGERARPERT